MKKFASFLMVAVMLASLLVISASAEQTNMEVTVPKFTKQPTFDGYVSEEEWGDVTVHVVTDGAATLDDNEVSYNEEFGLRNIFYWFDVEGASDSLSYDLWLRWDETYIYVAAIVNDPDPFSLPSGGEEIWNGDMLQMRIDEQGPSAIMLNEDPDFDYRTDAFNGTRYKKPWSNDTEVFNGIFGLVRGEVPTAWRCGKEYGNGYNLDNALIGITYVANDDDTCTTMYEGAIPWADVNATLVPKSGDIYGMSVVVGCSDSNSLNAWLQWGHGVTSTPEGTDQPQPKGTRGGSQAIVLTDETTVTPADGYPVATTSPETTAPVDTEDTAVNTVATGSSNETDNDTTTKAPANTNNTSANNNNDDDGGLSTGAIVGIVIAVVVVIAVVAFIIIKKKGSKESK